MLLLLKALAIPLFSLVLTILGSSLFGTFVSIRLQLAGESNEMIGMVTSAFYGGILFGSLFAPRWITRYGHLRALITGSVVSTIVILLLAAWINPFYWMALRGLGGIAMGALFVIIESWFLLIGTKTMRSQALSLYLAIFYGAVSVGQLMINLVNPLSFSPFFVAAFLSFLAIFPMAIGSFQVPPSHPTTEKLSLIEILRASPRGFLGGLISGMLLACIYGLAPVYGREIGFNISEIGTFMSVIVFGGLCLQWPLGKWADLHGRRGILIIACFAAAFFSSLIAVLQGTISFPVLLLICWLFGGFSFVLYPLSMAFTCDTMEECQVVATTGGFVLAYGIGAILGPLIAPFFMDWFHAKGLFYFLASICMLLGTIEACPGINYQKE